MSSNNRPKIKCGYCGWFLVGTDINVHNCFASYNEAVDVIVVDPNGIVTMQTVQHTDKRIKQKTPQRTPLIADTEDELLIDTVALRRPLWDHSIDIEERTRLKKEALWLEVSNIMGGKISPTKARKRWQYLRECYMKAKKKMTGYVSSGSGADASYPAQSSFRFYERMKFLSAVTPQATVSSLPDMKNDMNGRLAQLDKTANSVPENKISDQSQIPTPSTPKNIRNRENRSNRENSISPSDSASMANVELSSSGSSSTSRSTKGQKRAADFSELEVELLKYFKEARSKRDAVDSFLEQLGHILRRLPYIQRRNFQLKLLTLAIEEEDKSTME